MGKEGSSMKYYKSAKGRKAYKKKLAADRKRQKDDKPKWNKYRAEHKRMRTAAKKKYGAKAIKGKDIEKSTGRPVSKSKNRGNTRATSGDRRARGKKR